jgi:mRNA interferase MazF
MISYSFGDIVLVPFPFTDQTSSKKRPAVIISSSSYHQRKQDLIIMAITSQLHLAHSSIEYEIQNWQNAGLLNPSIIKSVVTTLDQSLVLKKLGKLSGVDQKALKKLINTILG